MDIEELFADVNVVGTAVLSEYLDVPRAEICRWAADNGVARIGTSYAFTLPEAEDLAAELFDEEDADQEEDEEDGKEEDTDDEDSDDEDSDDEDSDDEVEEDDADDSDDDDDEWR